jgi:hypothetical protein
MLAMRSEVIFSLTDLRYISIACPECNTVVTLDTEGHSKLRDQHDHFTPKKCPGCQRDYDSAIEHIDAFWKALAALKPIADRVSFRGEPESQSQPSKRK